MLKWWAGSNTRNLLVGLGSIQCFTHCDIPFATPQLLKWCVYEDVWIPATICHSTAVAATEDRGHCLVYSFSSILWVGFRHNVWQANPPPPSNFRRGENSSYIFALLFTLEHFRHSFHACATSVSVHTFQMHPIVHVITPY
jgi:hypothetical protein